MFRARFFWKLYASYALLIALSMAVVGVLIAQRMERESLEETERTLRAKAVLLRDLAAPELERSAEAEAGAGASFQRRVRRLGREIHTRLTVVRADGTVAADSEEAPAKMDNHAHRPEILAARGHGVGASTRFSRTLRKPMMYLALPIEAAGRTAGYVRTALPLTMVEERLAHLRGRVAFGAVTVALIALVLGFLFARRITAPLTRMTEAAHAIAEGDYGAKLPVRSSDEFGRLSAAFNTMAGQLRERMRTILTDRNKLAAILGSMVEGVVAVDRDERILHINKAAHHILKMDALDPVGKKIWEATRVREVSGALSASMKEASVAEGEARLGSGSGERTIRVHASPILGEAEDVVGGVVLLYDVTGLRRLETVRRDFVANVSHELKTPLTAIRGLLETLLDDAAMDEATRLRFLQKAQRQSMRLSALVTDLLTLSRVEAQDGKLERKPLDLREGARESARALRPSSEAKRIRLDLHLPGEPLPVLGDSEALRQVFDNLLDNAIKYTPEGGRVALRVQRHGLDALVEVEDTGIGIEARDRERIFERFYRVDKARSRELGGTGLGLSIVKHVVQAHGGEVSVRSAPGQGSTFRVRLPLSGASV